MNDIGEKRYKTPKGQLSLTWFVARRLGCVKKHKITPLFPFGLFCDYNIWENGSKTFQNFNLSKLDSNRFKRDKHTEQTCNSPFSVPKNGTLDAKKTKQNRDYFLMPTSPQDGKLLITEVIDITAAEHTKRGQWSEILCVFLHTP